jgi:hypothetical protein
LVALFFFASTDRFSLWLYQVEAEIANLSEQAAKKELSYSDFLDELLALEVHSKTEKHLTNARQLSGTPPKCLLVPIDQGAQTLVMVRLSENPPRVTERGRKQVHPLGLSPIHSVVCPKSTCACSPGPVS